MSGSPSQSASLGQPPDELVVELVGGVPELLPEELDVVLEPLVVDPLELVDDELVELPEVELDESGLVGQVAKSQTGTPLPGQIFGGFRSQLPFSGGQPS
ncbi:hypothetical protein [Pseudoteredinibacter isoporae]|uniref:Uncharacterized protein n=1 Tax=Pseudoteredinibacter isoporae TaxID=570281 RepID=A0A7X0JY26_9GAMM|nr:hypothetical protein [Pseudoteredinibacter isoporae]MBB6523844.1 hypothetical protein [Pseudoteredinibacter isoporae]NHO89361.1 hypothetical protein [Pseudoteredinibacter isoporae]NIB22468.1 hypothetical protein [Pseudoteredinibacter isoporae]